MKTGTFQFFDMDTLFKVLHAIREMQADGVIE